MLEAAPNTATRPGIDLLDSKIQLNPFPAYALLRESYPVCQLEPDGLWALSRFEDLQFALKRPDLFSSSSYKTLHEPDWIKEECKRNMFILSEDPPVHSKHRSLINKAFVPGVISNLAPFMRETAQELIAGLHRRSSIDFVKDFNFPYISKIMARLTGIDEQQNQEEFSQWIELSGAITLARPDDEFIEALENSVIRQNAYFDTVIHDRQKNPRDDFVTALTQAEVDGARLSNQQLRSVLDIIVVAGLHTTVNLLSICIIQLSQRPQMMRLLHTTPELIPKFIEEVLRFRSPAPCVLRSTTQPITLHDVKIPANTVVMMLLAAAHHDPKHFPNPDQFDMAREENKDHFGFGQGPHTCIGLALARLEVKIALESLLASGDHFSCPQESELDWYKTIFALGVQSLPFSFCHPSKKKIKVEIN